LIGRSGTANILYYLVESKTGGYRKISNSIHGNIVYMPAAIFDSINARISPHTAREHLWLCVKYLTQGMRDVTTPASNTAPLLPAPIQF
jgi:hypothetical protein